MVSSPSRIDVAMTTPIYVCSSVLILEEVYKTLPRERAISRSCYHWVGTALRKMQGHTEMC